MSDPFLAEIRMFGFNFSPRGWAACDGQILPIDQNQSLFSLMGTTYGGDGRTTFGLPEMRGRTPLHEGTGSGLSTRPLGQRSGEQSEVLDTAKIPSHTHAFQAVSEAGDDDLPGNNFLASSAQIYRDPAGTTLVPMHASTISNTGGGQSHTNMQPYLVVNFCIALQGLFPSRN